MNKKSASLLTVPLLAALLAVIFAACPHDVLQVNKDRQDEREKAQAEATVKPSVPAGWPVAATPFILRGESAATNIKVTWQPQEACTRYEVYRNGVSVATVAGDTFDDYALASDTTYRYAVRAYQGKTLASASAEAAATTFTPAAGPEWKYKNSTGARTTLVTPPPSPSGRKFGNKYYEFRTNGSGTLNLQGRFSDDGLTGWSAWTTLTTDGTNLATIGTWKNPDTGQDFTTAGAKLEGVAWHRVGNKVVLSAHREEAGSTYTLGNFLLASFYPGETYSSYAAWPGGAKAEVTFDNQPAFDGVRYASRDQSVFVDNDGKAYALTCTTTDTNFFLLDNDWTQPIEHTATVFVGKNRETPHIVRLDDWYYFFGSRQSGWYPSQTQYARSQTLAAEGWSELLDIGNSATFGSQFNRVEEYATEPVSYGMWGYRWAANWSTYARESANIQRVVPLTFNGGFASAKFFSELNYYAEHGLVGVQAGRLLSLGAPVRVSSSTPNASKTGLSGVTDGAEWSSSTRYQSGNVFPYNLVIDLGTFARLTEITMTTYMMGGSEGMFRYTVWASADGINYTRVVNGSANTRPGFTIDEVSDTEFYRYVELRVTGIVNAANNNSIASWADGIYEFSVYGSPF